MSKREPARREYMSVEDATFFLDKWAEEQTAIFTARERMKLDPRGMELIFAGAGSAMRARRGSQNGSSALNARTKRLGSAVIAELHGLDADFPYQFWDGDQFLLAKACARIAERPSAELIEAVDDEFPEKKPAKSRIDARNLRKWARRVLPRDSDWTRDTFGADAPPPRAPAPGDARALYRAERAKRMLKRHIV